MDLFFSIVVFLFGLVVGSFLNCLIYRLPYQGPGRGLKGRSFCPHCQHTLSWQDLIPVFSFFILKGKCRYCQKKISWQYPSVEIATGILFVLVTYHNFPNFLFSIFYFLIISFLIVIFVYDLKHYIIPDKIIYPAIVLTLVYLICLRPNFEQWRFGLEYFWAALGAAGFFAIIVLVSRGKWMGVGDIKLGFLMGLLLGWPSILVALFLAFITGAIIGIGLIVANRKTLKSAVPFGPFLVTGTLVALFYGETIINWYLNFLII